MKAILESSLMLILSAHVGWAMQRAPGPNDKQTPQQQQGGPIKVNDPASQSVPLKTGGMGGQLFVEQIRPMLEAHCLSCHNSEKKMSGLDLSTRESLLRGGSRGPAITPGNAQASLLYQAVAHEGELKMPYLGDKLPGESIARLAEWINSGTLYPQGPEEKLASKPAAHERPADTHWAFKAPQRPVIPEVKNRRWVSNPIDAFIAASHEKLGLEPLPKARKQVLLRRVYLDLIGLPPTPAELEAFLADTSKDAYEKVVDRLLTSPHYGERWGRHWMDIWRYSDWYGNYAFNLVEYSQRHLWRWRDWIVESLNQDKGYDRMIVEMLAGDEIAPADPSVLRATGYLARSWSKENRNDWLRDVVDHTATAFLGISLRCARCHAHKYDPISQDEYYRFRAFFEPLDVRVDHVPGQADLEIDGLARVFDAKLNAQTFKFILGDEKNQDKEKPLAPGVPEVLGPGETNIQPIPLPEEAYNPDFKSFVHRDLLAQARERVQKAQADMAGAKKTLIAAQQPALPALAGGAALIASASNTHPVAASFSGEAGKDVQSMDQLKNAAAMAEKELSTARADLVALEARIAADQAKFKNPPDPGAEVLANKAKEAARWADFCRLEEKSLRAQQQLDKEKLHKLSPSDLATFFSFEVRADLGEVTQLLRELEVTDKDYTPVGKIYPNSSTGRRLALARWIANKQNPLTARVAVNHIWLRHFGQALAPTVTDFGKKGQPPTHPELLDWLATEFMEKNWSMKAIHRLIVTSNTYCMQSATGEGSGKNLSIDPDNRTLWRMNPRRMEAEIIRDSMLYVVGQLDPTTGGPEIDKNPPRAPRPGTYDKPLEPLIEDHVTRRRSLYFRHSPEKEMVFLKLFNLADPVECYSRTESIVPQQALAMVNSKLSLKLSRLLAGQLSSDLSQQSSTDIFIEDAFKSVLGREPSAQERTASKEFLQKQTELLGRPDQLKPLPANPTDKPGEVLDVNPAADPHLRAREDFVHVLFSHNDFVTIQ